MDENKLKEIFAPMNNYYALLLKEKEDKAKEIADKVKDWQEYSLIVKSKIRSHRQEIIIALKDKSEFSSPKYLFEEAWNFLKRNQQVDYKEEDSDGFGVWDYVKDDFKMLDFLDKMLFETNKCIQLEKKEKLNLFIDKYLLIAQKELEKEKYFVVDSTWLVATAHSNEDLVPINSTGQIVNIIKARLRVPKRKIRKKIEPTLRKSIGDRDGWKCKHCGVDLSTKQSSFEVNHIDCNPSNNDPKNLELTCRNCNKKYRV